MNIRVAAAALAAPFALFISATAHAQASKTFAVQIGIGSALSSSSRNAASGTSFHAGAALALSSTTTLFALPGNQGLDVDYNYSSGHGGHIDDYGVTYANRISLIPKIAQPLTLHTVPYVGFGIGVFHNELHSQGTFVGSDLPTGSTVFVGSYNYSKSNTSLGGKLMAGVTTSSGFFVEGSYIISGSVAGVRTDTVNLGVGLEF